MFSSLCTLFFLIFYTVSLSFYSCIFKMFLCYFGLSWKVWRTALRLYSKAYFGFWVEKINFKTVAARCKCFCLFFCLTGKFACFLLFFIKNICKNSFQNARRSVYFCFFTIFVCLCTILPIFILKYPLSFLFYVVKYK